MGDEKRAVWPTAAQQELRGEELVHKLTGQLRLGADMFAQRFDGFYLWRPANALPAAASTARASLPISFETSHFKLPDARSLPHEALLFRLCKKPENPFGSRLTVGRAPNCDIVIRTPFVSKLHACLIKGEAAVTVCDMGSENGTRVNGTRLREHDTVNLAPGDQLALGTLDFEFINALMLYVRLDDSVAPLGD